MKTETVIGRIFVSVYCDCFVCKVVRGNGHEFLFTCGVCRRLNSREAGWEQSFTMVGLCVKVACV